MPVECYGHGSHPLNSMRTIWTGYITLLQLALALAAVGVASARPTASSLGLNAGRLRRLASRHVVCGIIAALLPLAIRFVLLPAIPIPAPAVQEEFSDLLQADTFAHGRLANPPHPMSVFFDSVHIIQYPTYASARLPGIAVFLWAGEAMFHQPWLGVCLAVAAMCGAFYWMLLGWTRPLWAFVCAILFGLRFGIFTYWMNSYWPGSPAALGGALALGAVPRLARQPALSTAVLFGVGCVILFMNRPLEGLVFIIPAAIAVAIAWFQSRRPIPWRDIAVKVMIPVFAIGVTAAAAMLLYNKATTGCPNVLAYSVWRHGQAIVPIFWLAPIRHDHLVYYSLQTWQFFHVWEVDIYESLHSGWLLRMSILTGHVLEFFSGDVGILFLAGLLFPPLGRMRKHPKLWLGFYLAAFPAAGIGILVRIGRSTDPAFLALLAYAFVLAIRFGPKSGRLILPIVALFLGFGLRLATTYTMPTYYPEFLAPAMVLVADGFRRLHAWSRERRLGAAIARNLCLACITMVAVQAAIPVSGFHLTGEAPFYMTSYENRLTERGRVENFLEEQPGPQLAIVRYTHQHDVLLEWVWNKADIDHQKVVWAREQKPEWTSHLLRYYSSRKAWLIEPDVNPPRVTPYPALPPPETTDPLPEARYVNTPKPGACR